MLDTVSFIYYSAARSSNQVIQSISFFLVAMMSEASEISLETALNATNALFLKNLSKPNVVDLPRGPVSPTDLPLDHPKDKSKAKHFFDFVGPIAFDATLQSQVSSAAKDGRFADMPAPFRLKTSPGMSYGLQLVVLPLPNAQHFLLKHIIFQDQVKAEFVSTLCHGEVHTVSWQANAKNTKRRL